MGTTEYPHTTDEGKTVWACCFSSIGPACEHRRYAREAQRYNGWANRETWAVALHIKNDQGWQESVHEAVRNAADGFRQDPPIWAVYDNEAEEARDMATAVGDAIRESVEEALTPEDSDDYFGRRITDGQWGALQDIGSLWRVSWTELGAAFLEDVEVS